MNRRYIDSHAHIFFEDYKNDLPDVLIRAKDAGVEYIIVPGTDLSSSREAVALAGRFGNLYAGVGIHPHESSKVQDADVDKIEDLSRNSKVVAIGEIGLDYHYDFSPKEIQIEVFKRQLEIAVRCNLPVIIHTRESSDDVLNIVRKIVEAYPDWRKIGEEPLRGVFHCFPGTAEEARYLKTIGFYVSYPGIVTFKNSDSIEVIKQIGIKNILLETDSPYMSPVPLRGKRNEPANIVLIGKKIAESLNLSEEEVASITSENAEKLFGLSSE